MKTPLKIKISLKDLPHKCERTLLVPEQINMLQLHFLIQHSFGWHNAHLFEFQDKKWKSEISIGVPNDNHLDFDFIETLTASDTKLKNVFIDNNASKAFWYWYDFGDDWWHRISFLKVTNKDMKAYDSTPICLKAIGKCPPEDVGGPWGYADFLEIINDKNHPEYEEFREWQGLDFDNIYDEFDVDLTDINQRLKQYFKSKQWKYKLSDY